MPANVGGQTVTLKYYDPANSDVVNERFMGIRPRGIYQGGYLTKTAPNTATLSPLVCEIGDDSDQVRIETTNVGSTPSFNLTLANSYAVLRWTRTDSQALDYMDFIATGSPGDNDLIIGKANIVAGAITTFTYVERTVPDLHKFFLKVEPTETPSSSVRVRPGRSHTGFGHQNIVDQLLDLSGYSALDAIYIYINDTGGLAHSKVQATYAGMALLAKVTYPADGTIDESDIEDARCFIDSPAIPDGVTIERSSSGKLQTMRVAGETIQIVNYQTGAVSSWTAIIPDDDTIPQNYEGNQVMTLAITPTNAANKLKIDVVVHIANNGGGWPNVAALFQDSIQSALACSFCSNDTNQTIPLKFTHFMTAGTGVATTFKIRVGASGGGCTVNGRSGGRRYGGRVASSITITEIQV